MAQCAICLEAITTKTFIQLTTCRHEFHFDCQMKWNQKNNTCPLCRCPIKISDIFKFLMYEYRVSTNPPENNFFQYLLDNVDLIEPDSDKEKYFTNFSIFLKNLKVMYDDDQSKEFSGSLRPLYVMKTFLDTLIFIYDNINTIIDKNDDLFVIIKSVHFYKGINGLLKAIK